MKYLIAYDAYSIYEEHFCLSITNEEKVLP